MIFTVKNQTPPMKTVPTEITPRLCLNVAFEDFFVLSLLNIFPVFSSSPFATKDTEVYIQALVTDTSKEIPERIINQIKN